MKRFCPLRLADPLLLNFLDEYFIVRRINLSFSSFNYMVYWLYVAVLIFAWLRIFIYWFSVIWASVNKESAYSEIYVTKIFLLWEAEAFLILKALVGFVSKASLKSLAESVLPADIRRILVAWLVQVSQQYFEDLLIFYVCSFRCSLQRPIFDDHSYLKRVVFRNLSIRFGNTFNA